VLSVLGCSVWVWLQIRFYARCDTGMIYCVAVGVSWWMGIVGVLVVLPLDITASVDPDIEFDFLKVLWKVNYWVTFIWCWFICPVAMEYYAAGEFTTQDKLKAALRMNLRYYVIVGTVLTLVIIAVAFKEGFQPAKISGFLIAATNCYGMSLVVVMTGYGIVQVPRSIWNRSNPGRLLKWYYIGAPAVETMLLDSQSDLQEIVLRASSLRCAESDILAALQARAEEIQSTMLADLPSSRRRYLSCSIDDEFDASSESLASLNYKLKKAVSQLQRAEYDWEVLMNHTHVLEESVGDGEYRRLSVEGDEIAPGGQDDERKVDRSMMWKIAGVVLMVLSAVLLWGECVTAFSTSLSLFAVVTSHSSGLVLWFFTCFVLLYLVICAYSALFKFKLLDSLALHGNQQTDAYCLLKNASYLGRLQFSLGINYINMLHSENLKELSLYSIVGDMDVVPFLGTSFNHVIIFVILLVTGCTFFNVLDRVLRAFGIDTRSDPTSTGVTLRVCEEKVAEGRQLVQRYRERDQRRRNQTANQSNQYYSMRSFTTE